MDKRFLAIVTIIVIGFGAFILLNKKDVAVSSEPTNYVVGSNKYGVRLVEYGDFECPACGQYYPIVKQIKEEYKDLIEFQFQHFPIDAIHPAARAAHRAAEAAGKQGKFFEMHDILYENQSAWKGIGNPASVFASYASQLGLDAKQFEADVKSELTNSSINADINEGKLAGATGTPTFVLNGKKIEENPRTIAAFRELINTALKEKDPGVTLPAALTEQTTQPVNSTQTQAPQSE